MSDTGSSGIFVTEGSPAGAPIDLRRETIAAFIGPAPRGPADMPVALRSVSEYQRRFGCPDTPSRMESYLRQFFANGGGVAIVVRICRSQHRARIHLPGSGGSTTLEAVCPGHYEFLRASVDFDGIDPGRPDLFNLVVQRVASPLRPLVVEQELYPAVSWQPRSADYLGDALLTSRLVRLDGVPGGPPVRTVGPGVAASAAYIYSDGTRGASDCPTDYDLIGSPSDGTGLYALEQIPTLDLLCLVPPRSGEAIGPVALFAAERYCRRRQALMLVDPPGGWRSVHDAVSDSRPLGLDSPNVMTYFPVPPAGSLLGAIAGALVASDANDGVWVSSTDKLKLSGAGRPGIPLDAESVRALRRCGINAAVRDHRGGVALQGLVTGGRRAGLSPEWASLTLRRTVLFILSGIARGSGWALFNAAEETTMIELRRQLEHFLQTLEDAGALHADGGVPGWYLQGRAVDGPELLIELGLGLRRPGEFLSFRIRQRHGECEIRELGWQPALARAV